MFSAKIVCDSISTVGHRLTTMEVCFPRIVLAEFNTHRMFSRNSASSRAIPTAKLLEQVQTAPYLPVFYGKNQAGMSAAEELSPELKAEAEATFLNHRRKTTASVATLHSLGMHKQDANRLLEPYMWQTVIVTATEWSNFFHLRNNQQAHPAIQHVAELMEKEYATSTPNTLSADYWHLPYIQPDEVWEGTEEEVLITQKKVSVGRCARVSYLTHDGKRDHEADVALHDRLRVNGHLSPFEHVARPMRSRELDIFSRPTWVWTEDGWGAQGNGTTYFLGNFNGWVQERKLIPQEADILG